MNRDEAIAVALEWIRATHGQAADQLRVLTENVVLVRGQWYVPYNAVDDDIVPLPAVEVPDDGSAPRRFVPSGPPSPWTRGVPEFWPEPGPDLAVVDPEWDQQAFAHLSVPEAAVLGWVRAPGSDEFRRNAAYRPGSVWLGWPAPQTPADKFLGYYQQEWLGDDPRLFAGFLDITVYCPAGKPYRVHDEDGRTWLEAYSAPVHMPPRTWSWREISVRELLSTMSADEVRINPGHPTQVQLPKRIVNSLHRWPEPFPHPPAVARELPEFDHAWTERVVEALLALDPPSEPHLAKVVRARLMERLDEAKANGFTIEGDERAALTDALIWTCSGRKGPPPAGAQRFWGHGTTPMWIEPTFGKANEWDQFGTQPHAWAWVAGAYVGFALGESIAGGDGTLTAGLLRVTDDLVRDAHDRPKNERRSLDRHPRGWLDAMLPVAAPVPEVLGLVAAVVSGDHWLAGPLWNADISPVFDRVLDRAALSRATHVALTELGLYPHILQLREQRETPVRDQWLDTPWERALLIASKHGHDPSAALSAAHDPLTSALVGALIGAWHGIPGLPSDPPNRDLLESLATEAHVMFNPKYTPSAPNHPGLPPITDAMRVEARKHPDGWLWCADKEADPRLLGGLPTPTLLGAYRVGPDGEPTGESWLNDEYRPGPRRLGLPDPENPFENVLNLVTTGWLPYEAVLAPALDTEFWTVPAPDGGPMIVRDAEGNHVLAVYSSSRYLPPDTDTPERLVLRPMLSVLAGVLVVVNAGGQVGVDMRGEHLAEVASDDRMTNEDQNT